MLRNALFVLASMLVTSPLFAQVASNTYAQELVYQTLAKHPEIVAMTLHVTPPKQIGNTVIASSTGRIGEKSGARILKVISSGTTTAVLNKAGDRLEVMEALRDVTGDTVGGLSVVYPFKPGDQQAPFIKRADEVQKWLQRRTSNLANLTQPYRFDPSIPTNTYAQQLVDQTLASHPDVLILALHVTPPGASANMIVASNIGRIGKKADSDDLRAIRTGIPNLEVNGNRFEVEVRLKNAQAQTIGAVGIVFPYKPGDDKSALEHRGLAIRDALQAEIPSVTALMGPATFVATDTVPVKLSRRSTAWKPEYSGDFDHFGVDAKRNQLLLAAEDHGTLEVFNLHTGAHERTLTSFSTPHAILYLPKRDRLIVTDSGKGGTRILDAGTFKVVGHIKLAPGADSMAYDAPRQRLYIVTGGMDVGMKDCFLNEVDPFNGHVYRKLRFDSDHVEAVAPESHGNRIFVNVADKDYVAVVDKHSFQVIARWPLVGARTNLTMALDEGDHRLFVGTRNPSRLFVINTDTGATVATLNAPATSDALFFDGANKRIYVPGGNGYLAVYQEYDPDNYVELGRVATAQGAKSGILLTDLKRIYLAASPGEHTKGGSILWLSLNH